MKQILNSLFILFVFSFGLHAQIYKTESGKAVFLSKVPLHDFEGSSDQLVGLINLEDKTVDFYLDLETLDTGNGKRDKDMRLTLETKKFPFGEFFGKLVSDFDPTSSEIQAAKVEGVFKIHGKEKEVEIDGTLQMTAEGILLKAGWILNLEDYAIKPPRLLIIKVDEEQEININALLTPKESN